jgi:hypothetical protein
MKKNDIETAAMLAVILAAGYFWWKGRSKPTRAALTNQDVNIAMTGSIAAKTENPVGV